MLVQDNPMYSTASNNIFCYVCKKNNFNYAFKIGKNKFLECSNCHTTIPEKNLNPISDHPYTERDSNALTKLIIETIDERHAQGPFLLIASGKEKSLVDKLMLSLPPHTICTAPNEFIKFEKQKFGAVIILMPISTINNLHDFLQRIHRNLISNGFLFFLQPMVDSSQAKIMRNGWLEWHQPHAFYPTRDALHMMLLNENFDRLWFRKARYPYTLDYIRKRFKASRKYLLSYLLSLTLIFPSFFRRIKFKLPSSHIIVSCQAAIPKINSTLSIIIPVYNEKNTFEELIQSLLAKNIAGIRKEIIIIESRSTDGTRDLVKKYENHPDVHVIWQEKANGKGFAVREGLAHATGDYVLIQDADLEYDINDYENLLAPLQNNQAMWVLGSRHTGTWKIREFNDAAALATIFNIGHLFFTWFINFLTRQRMTDPFTMFKVFRRDALYGLEFVCKRFDFDHEMVIKFVRKGYQPLELPVNYNARSFAEGKKVSFTKDGLTWIFTDLKLRFGRLGKWSN